MKCMLLCFQLVFTYGDKKYLQLIVRKMDGTYSSVVDVAIVFG